MLWFASMVAASPVLVEMQTLVRHQTLSAHLPMRLHWNFTASRWSKA